MTDEAVIQEGVPTAVQPRRRTWGVVVVWVLVLGFLALMGVGLLRSQQGPISVGARAPQFSLKTFDGQVYNTAAMPGKVVVVNFWASWCKPCEQEAADLQAAYQQYKDQGVVFLGVNYVDTEPEGACLPVAFRHHLSQWARPGNACFPGVSHPRGARDLRRWAGRVVEERQDRPVQFRGRNCIGDRGCSRTVAAVGAARRSIASPGGGTTVVSGAAGGSRLPPGCGDRILDSHGLTTWTLARFSSCLRSPSW